MQHALVSKAAPLALALVIAVGCGQAPPDAVQPAGQGETVFATGSDPTNPFFVSLGTNARTCATCHDAAAAWTVTPAALQARFDASAGADPIFRVNDGATSPAADVSTVAARRSAYDLLLRRGLVRVGQPIPAAAEFTLAAVDDPYGFASAAELSLFRRPLPAANLRFATQIMWDAREPSLAQQASDATRGHAQAMQVDAAQMDRIVAFESEIYTAVRVDDVAGDLASDGATGGAALLVNADLRPGLGDPTAVGFDRNVFQLFGAWSGADASTAEGRGRAAIARGEQLFDTHRFRIRGAPGIADQQGTCSTCHDTPDVGSHSTPVAIDIGVSDPTGADLPVYTLRQVTTGQTVTTTDPGLALTTGRWADIGKFKVPMLRGLALRPPYFHDGRADSLDDVVRFYDRKFDLHLSGDEQADLVAFLTAL